MATVTGRTAESNGGPLGARKTMIIMVTVVGCIAILWPKVFYPMMVGPGQTKNVIKDHRGPGCCDVVLDQEKFANASIDFANQQNLFRKRNVGPTTEDSSSIRQERPPHLRSETVHPAMRERGRAIPHVGSVHSERPQSPPRIVEGRPGPIPGMRPPMGAGSHQPTKSANSMGFIMPLYTIGIVSFFIYTILKLIFKKTPTAPYPEIKPDPAFRDEVFTTDTYIKRPDSGNTKLGQPIAAAENGVPASAVPVSNGNATSNFSHSVQAEISVDYEQLAAKQDHSAVKDLSEAPVQSYDSTVTGSVSEETEYNEHVVSTNDDVVQPSYEPATEKVVDGIVVKKVVQFDDVGTSSEVVEQVASQIVEEVLQEAEEKIIEKTEAVAVELVQKVVEQAETTVHQKDLDASEIAVNSAFVENGDESSVIQSLVTQEEEIVEDLEMTARELRDDQTVCWSQDNTDSSIDAQDSGVYTNTEELEIVAISKRIEEPSADAIGTDEIVADPVEVETIPEPAHSIQADDLQLENASEQQGSVATTTSDEPVEEIKLSVNNVELEPLEDTASQIEISDHVDSEASILETISARMEAAVAEQAEEAEIRAIANDLVTEVLEQAEQIAYEKSDAEELSYDPATQKLVDGQIIDCIVTETNEVSTSSDEIKTEEVSPAAEVLLETNEGITLSEEIKIKEVLTVIDSNDDSINVQQEITSSDEIRTEEITAQLIEPDSVETPKKEASIIQERQKETTDDSTVSSSYVEEPIVDQQLSEPPIVEVGTIADVEETTMTAKDPDAIIDGNDLEEGTVTVLPVEEVVETIEESIVKQVYCEPTSVQKPIVGALVDADKTFEEIVECEQQHSTPSIEITTEAIVDSQVSECSSVEHIPEQTKENNPEASHIGFSSAEEVIVEEIVEVIEASYVEPVSAEPISVKELSQESPTVYTVVGVEESVNESLTQCTEGEQDNATSAVNMNVEQITKSQTLECNTTNDDAFDDDTELPKYDPATQKLVDGIVINRFEGGSSVAIESTTSAEIPESVATEQSSEHVDIEAGVVKEELIEIEQSIPTIEEAETRLEAIDCSTTDTSDGQSNTELIERTESQKPSQIPVVETVEAVVADEVKTIQETVVSTQLDDVKLEIDSEQEAIAAIHEEVQIPEAGATQSEEMKTILESTVSTQQDDLGLENESDQGALVAAHEISEESQSQPELVTDRVEVLQTISESAVSHQEDDVKCENESEQEVLIKSHEASEEGQITETVVDLVEVEAISEPAPSIQADNLELENETEQQDSEATPEAPQTKHIEVTELESVPESSPEMPVGTLSLQEGSDEPSGSAVEPSEAIDPISKTKTAEPSSSSAEEEKNVPEITSQVASTLADFSKEAEPVVYVEKVSEVEVPHSEIEEPEKSSSVAIPEKDVQDTSSQSVETNEPCDLTKQELSADFVDILETPSEPVDFVEKVCEVEVPHSEIEEPEKSSSVAIPEKDVQDTSSQSVETNEPCDLTKQESSADSADILETPTALEVIHADTEKPDVSQAVSDIVIQDSPLILDSSVESSDLPDKVIEAEAPLSQNEQSDGSIPNAAAEDISQEPCPQVVAACAPSDFSKEELFVESIASLQVGGPEAVTDGSSALSDDTKPAEALPETTTEKVPATESQKEVPSSIANEKIVDKVVTENIEEIIHGDNERVEVNTNVLVDEMKVDSVTDTKKDQIPTIELSDEIVVEASKESPPNDSVIEETPTSADEQLIENLVTVPETMITTEVVNEACSTAPVIYNGDESTAIIICDARVDEHEEVCEKKATVSFVQGPTIEEVADETVSAPCEGHATEEHVIKVAVERPETSETISEVIDEPIVTSPEVSRATSSSPTPQVAAVPVLDIISENQEEVAPLEVEPVTTASDDGEQEIGRNGTGHDQDNRQYECHPEGPVVTAIQGLIIAADEQLLKIDSIKKSANNLSKETEETDNTETAEKSSAESTGRAAENSQHPVKNEQLETEQPEIDDEVAAEKEDVLKVEKQRDTGATPKKRETSEDRGISRSSSNVKVIPMEKKAAYEPGQQTSRPNSPVQSVTLDSSMAVDVDSAEPKCVLLDTKAPQTSKVLLADSELSVETLDACQKTDEDAPFDLNLIVVFESVSNLNQGRSLELNVLLGSEPTSTVVQPSAATRVASPTREVVLSGKMKLSLVKLDDIEKKSTDDIVMKPEEGSNKKGGSPHFGRNEE